MEFNKTIERQVVETKVIEDLCGNEIEIKIDSNGERYIKGWWISNEKRSCWVCGLDETDVPEDFDWSHVTIDMARRINSSEEMILDLIEDIKATDEGYICFYSADWD